jgi:hypothetical protein
MGNSRAFRRRLKAQQQNRPPEQQHAQPGRYRKGHVPWNKGLALTTRPSLSTTRRWLAQNVADGWAERKTAEPGGKPGRPPVMYRITGEGLAQPGVPDAVRQVQMRNLRRWENAKKRSREQSHARRLKKLQAEETVLKRRLAVAVSAAEQARAELERLDLAAETVTHATDALLAGDGSTPVRLHPEEVDALVEYRLAVRGEGDTLLLNPAWLKEFKAARGDAP